MIFNDISDKEIDIEFLEYKIEIDKLLNDYLIESNILSLGIYTEDENETVPEQKQSKFGAFISRIADAIMNALKNLANAVASLFGSKDHIDTQSFLKSNAGKEIYTVDIEKINKECDDKILEGRKMIQAISKGTHIDDHVVAKYVDGAANFASKYGKAVITSAAALAVAPKIRDWVNDKFHLIQKGKTETLRSVALKEYRREHNIEEGKISKIFNAMGTYAGKFVNNGMKFIKTFKGYQSVENKKNAENNQK